MPALVKRIGLKAFRLAGLRLDCFILDKCAQDDCTDQDVVTLADTLRSCREPTGTVSVKDKWAHDWAHYQPLILLVRWYIRVPPPEI